jgi:SET domain-containing protein
MSRKPPLVEVRESDIQGRGVYAARPIKKGTWIIEYTGERISHAEADMRYDDEHMERHHTFLFTIDEHVCIDAFIGGNEARYVNHSCDPNCETVLADGEIHIVAMRDIAAGEELTYDYGYTLDDESVEEALRRYPCRCGAASCRGTILRLERAPTANS